MTKKEYVLQFLERMGRENDIALAMSLIIQTGELTDDMFNLLYTIIQQGINDMTKEQDIIAMHKIQQHIKKIQQQEQESYNEEDLDELLAQI